VGVIGLCVLITVCVWECMFTC